MADVTHMLYAFVFASCFVYIVTKYLSLHGSGVLCVETGRWTFGALRMSFTSMEFWLDGGLFSEGQ